MCVGLCKLAQRIVHESSHQRPFTLSSPGSFRRPDAKRKAEKDEDDEEEKLFGKAQPESDNEAPGEDDKKEESGESALLREVRYKLEFFDLFNAGT